MQQFYKIWYSSKYWGM